MLTQIPRLHIKRVCEATKEYGAMKYYITYKHHSVSRAPVIEYEGTLRGAKRKATREFGGQFIDYQLVIGDGREVISTKTVGEGRWFDYPATNRPAWYF